MIGIRNIFVDAKSQHRPEDGWFVIGAPSIGTLMLKTWVSDLMADLLERTSAYEAPAKLEIARRFCIRYHAYSLIPLQGR